MRAISHPAVQEVGLAVLVRVAGPAAQFFVAIELKVHFPFPRWPRESRPLHLVHHRDGPSSTLNRESPVHCISYIHHRDDPSSTPNRLVSRTLLHFESLKKSRNVVLGDVVRGEFPGDVVEHILRQPDGKYFGVDGCEGWHRACSVEPTRAGEHQRRAYRKAGSSTGA